MTVTVRFITFSCVLLALSVITLAQKNDVEARAAVAGGAPHFATKGPMNVKRFQFSHN